jgi:hypothetical protein
MRPCIILEKRRGTNHASLVAAKYYQPRASFDANRNVNLHSQVLAILTSFPEHRVVIGVDSLGKEDLLVAIATRLHTKVWNPVFFPVCGKLYSLFENLSMFARQPPLWCLRQGGCTRARNLDFFPSQS